MSARNRRGTCAYCGQQKKLTVDHVPPKLLLARPYPAHLLTVPACLDCNRGFMKDDEYTRTVLSLDLRASFNFDAQTNLPAVLRSLQRPNAKGLAEYLAGQASNSRIVTPSGAPITLIEPDRGRIDGTGKRLIRGLYYVEMQTPLPLTAIIRAASKATVDPTDPAILEFARFYSKFSDSRNGAVGTAFSYAAAIGGGISIWMMLLYDYFMWIGTVDCRHCDTSSVIEAAPALSV